MEHFKEHLRPEPLQCGHCRAAKKDEGLKVKAETFTLAHEKRLVEIDVLYEAIDLAIDEKNVLITGHIVKKVSILYKIDWSWINGSFIKCHMKHL